MPGSHTPPTFNPPFPAAAAGSDDGSHEEEQAEEQQGSEAEAASGSGSSGGEEDSESEEDEEEEGLSEGDEDDTKPLSQRASYADKHALPQPTAPKPRRTRTNAFPRIPRWVLLGSGRGRRVAFPAPPARQWPAACHGAASCTCCLGAAWLRQPIDRSKPARGVAAAAAC